MGCAFVCGRDARSFFPARALFSAELVVIDKALRFIEVSGDTDHIILTLPKQPIGAKSISSCQPTGVGCIITSYIFGPRWDICQLLLDTQPCRRRRQ